MSPFRPTPVSAAVNGGLSMGSASSANSVMVNPFGKVLLAVNWAVEPNAGNVDHCLFLTPFIEGCGGRVRRRPLDHYIRSFDEADCVALRIDQGVVGLPSGQAGVAVGITGEGDVDPVTQGLDLTPGATITGDLGDVLLLNGADVLAIGESAVGSRLVQDRLEDGQGHCFAYHGGRNGIQVQEKIQVEPGRWRTSARFRWRRRSCPPHWSDRHRNAALVERELLAVGLGDADVVAIGSCRRCSQRYRRTW
ncbi:hypothetical protein WP1_254 [Pseudomonas phage WP1]